MVKRSNHTTNNGMYDFVTLALKSVKNSVLLRGTRGKVDPSPNGVEPGKVGPRDYRVATVKLCGDSRIVSKWTNAGGQMEPRRWARNMEMRLDKFRYCFILGANKEDQSQPGTSTNSCSTSSDNKTKRLTRLPTWAPKESMRLTSVRCLRCVCGWTQEKRWEDWF